ncbi:MAG: extracellular solute-binding protein [Acetatifactor sp.]|nr:extracellular solute-binding protein [Acetatifactor sp.]
MARKSKKVVAAVLTASMVSQIFFGEHAAGVVRAETEPSGGTENRQQTEESFSIERLTSNYTIVSSGYTAADYRGDPVLWQMDKVLSSGDTGYLAENSYGYENGVVDVTSGDTIHLTVTVPETALYWLGFDYLSYDESILPIEFALKVDGDYPFYESRNLSFETTWASVGEVSHDRYGNEIVAMPDKLIQWETKYLSDASYRRARPLSLELEQGTHELEINVSEGTFLLGNISLEAPVEVPEYTGAESAPGSELIAIEGEDFYLRNDSAIHAIGEYDSAVNPLSATDTVLNTVDSDSFKTAGQTITYEFEVEQAGYYYLAMNYKQSDKNDFPVFLDFRIDGEIPNTAFQSWKAEYTTKYRNTTLQDDDGNRLSVYLDKGKHTLSITISIENLLYVLEQVDQIMNGINDLSLEVTKVAGTNKDKYRDLRLTRYIPDVQERLYGWVDMLYELAEIGTQYVKEDDPEDVAAFAYLIIAAKQLKSLGDEPNDLIYRVAELSTSVNSINTQIANFIDLINDNNLSIDRIYLYQDDAKLPKKLNIFQSMGLSVKRFVNSFFGTSYSASNIDESHLQVWVNRPRQYVEIMQKMIDEQFTAKTGIEVDLSLMTDANKLVLSNASGDTPDIATGINYAIPFELGIRGALVDLTKFDNYKEVFGRYSRGLVVSSVIGEGLYSLPETMNFYVMFYRSDILEKLGLDAPDTMDDLIAMLPDLQMRGLNVYYPTASMLVMRNFHGTTPLIFQYGGSLYGDTATELTVNSETSIEGITALTELFTLYNLPVDVPNFYQHFRNGDLPIGIADFNAYNLILNAAPEIANSWEIGLVPGVEDPDTGEIYRYMSGGAESTVMFKSDDEREQQAWEFMSWWSSAEVQAEFGQMLQIMYGDEYIWPTANLEAFGNLPYPTAHKDIIMEQAENILEAPRLPASYMMERELSNAFNDIVVNGYTLRTRIDKMVKTVDRETTRKLEELGYIDSDGNVQEEYLVPSVDVVNRIFGD